MTPLHHQAKRQLKRSLHSLRKRLRRTLVRRNALHELALADEAVRLMSDGYVKLNNVVDSSLVDKWRNDYCVDAAHLLPSTKNTVFPIYNRELHSILNDNDMTELLRFYYRTLYNKEPTLQIVPHLVITYPSVDQDSYTPETNHFPAQWHTDYYSEFTIHIPLTAITEDTSHTKYILGSQYSLTFPSASTPMAPRTHSLTNCVADPGDALLIDVDGWHRAQLRKNSLRALIQVKYTAGNDLLRFTESRKVQEQIKDSILHTAAFERIRATLQADLNYIESLDASSSPDNIFSDARRLYSQYLKGNPQ